MDKPLSSIETLIPRKAKFHWYIKSWIKRLDTSYKLIKFLSGRRSSADAVVNVNVVTVEFRFGAVVLIKILVFKATAYAPVLIEFHSFSHFILTNFNQSIN